MVGYNVWATTRTQSIPALVDLTARQRTLAERYVKDVVLQVEGQKADPGQSMDLLRDTAATLLTWRARRTGRFRRADHRA